EQPAEDNQNAQPEQALYNMTANYFIVPKDEEADKKIALLTFDDGPKDRDMIETMIKVLGDHNAKAIFFVNGNRAKQNPDLLKLLHESGHAIGNHGWSHVNPGSASAEVIDKEVIDTSQIIEEVIGSKPKFFRPPHGSGNDYLKQTVKDEGMLYMTWTTSPEDWENANKSAEMVIKNTMERVHNGV